MKVRYPCRLTRGQGVVGGQTSVVSRVGVVPPGRFMINQVMDEPPLALSNDPSAPNDVRMKSIDENNQI